mmetsp:Transcript_43717/g.95164  ORF Transcript_43717/g.95164 Transcript_43717/m.95164 type:complete len:211 (+) Transcript_43717:127-759(+)
MGSRSGSNPLQRLLLVREEAYPWLLRQRRDELSELYERPWANDGSASKAGTVVLQEAHDRPNCSRRAADPTDQVNESPASLAGRELRHATSDTFQDFLGRLLGAEATHFELHGAIFPEEALHAPQLVSTSDIDQGLLHLHRSGPTRIPGSAHGRAYHIAELNQIFAENRRGHPTQPVRLENWAKHRRHLEVHLQGHSTGCLSTWDIFEAR